MNWGVPRGPAAALAALHFRDPHPELLTALTDAEWRDALAFTDRTQLTLPLRLVARDAMPGWAQDGVDASASRNLERLRRFEELYRSIDSQMRAAGVEYLALKGLTHCPDFGTQPSTRVQYDIDLYAPQAQIFAARDAIVALGYEPLQDMSRFPTDHLPSLIRKTGWEWRGDFFDPEIPIAVEIHFQFWNQRLERLEAPGTQEFWDRRVSRSIAGASIQTLSSPDALAFASLHLLKHVVQGSARPFHVLEIARFLESHARDEGFWSTWISLHEPQLRRLQAAMFLLAREWFGCETGPAAQEEMDRLPSATHRWFDEFAASPVRQIFQPAKDELWLHLSLIDSPLDALAVARRRLLPFSLPGPVDAVHIPERDLTWQRRMLQRARWATHVLRRAVHHAAALPPAATAGVRWWWKINPMGSQFWTFLAAAALFNFAFFIYVLLFNLRLLDLGFRENTLGFIGGASTLGCVAGTLPAAAAVRRFGLRRTLLGAIAGTSLLAVLRALATGRMELAALGFIGGAAFSAWAVVMTPTIAGTAPEKNRIWRVRHFLRRDVHDRHRRGMDWRPIACIDARQTTGVAVRVGACGARPDPRRAFAHRGSNHRTTSSEGLPQCEISDSLHGAIRSVEPGYRLVQSVFQRVLCTVGLQCRAHWNHLFGVAIRADRRGFACAAGVSPHRNGTRSGVDDGGRGGIPGLSRRASIRRPGYGVCHLHGLPVDERTRPEHAADERRVRTRAKRGRGGELPGDVRRGGHLAIRRWGPAGTIWLRADAGLFGCACACGGRGHGATDGGAPAHDFCGACYGGARELKVGMVGGSRGSRGSRGSQNEGRASRGLRALLARAGPIYAAISSSSESSESSESSKLPCRTS